MDIFFLVMNMLSPPWSSECIDASLPMARLFSLIASCHLFQIK